MTDAEFAQKVRDALKAAEAKLWEARRSRKRLDVDALFKLQDGSLVFATVTATESQKFQ